MSLTFAYWIAGLLALYAGLGVVFTIPFLWKGLCRIDPTTEGGSLGFRIIIIPGIIALWPLLAQHWLTGKTAPPAEKNPHRTATHS